MIKKITSAALVFLASSIITSSRAEPGKSLTIPISGRVDIQQQIVSYTCNAKKGNNSAKLLSTLPKKIIKVNYINAGDISIAVLPINGKTQVFSNVISASGDKYSAADHVWWTEGEDATFSSETDTSAQVHCHEIKS